MTARATRSVADRGDEDVGVRGVSKFEVSDWYSQMRAYEKTGRRSGYAIEICKEQQDDHARVNMAAASAGRAPERR